jgi:NADP-dependent 3-hydroxy acid dehydrogenase YdfG
MDDVRIALVTGASRGFGRSMAAHLNLPTVLTRSVVPTHSVGRPAASLSSPAAPLTCSAGGAYSLSARPCSRSRRR